MSKTYKLEWRGLQAPRQNVRGASRVFCARMSQWAHEGGEPADELLEEVEAERLDRWGDSLLGTKCIDRFGDWPIDEVDGRKLSDYQLAVAQSALVSGIALALDCGLGKTITSLAIADMYRHSYGHSRLYVAAPLNAMGAWERHREWIADRWQDFKIFSVDSAHKYTALPHWPGGTLIVDEAHMLGSAGARRTKSVHELRRAFDCCIPLTGTLLHAGIEKALSVLDLVVPGAAGFSNPMNCGAHFKCLSRVQFPGPGGRQVTRTKINTPAHGRTEEYMKFLTPFVVALSVDSKAVENDIDLPPQHIVNVWDELPDNRSIEELMVEQVRVHMEQNDGEIPTAQKVMIDLGRAGLPQKLAWLHDNVDPDEPFVLFGAFLDTLNEAAQLLYEKGITFGRIDGATFAEKRQTIQKRFQAGELQCVLAQCKAGSVSIDLFRSQVSLCLDHTWSAIDYEQLRARTHRRGQTEETYHLDFMYNRVQKTIVQSLRDKCSFNTQAAVYQENAGILKSVIEDLTHNRT